MKKLISLFSLLFLITFTFTDCKNSVKTDDEDDEKSEKLTKGGKIESDCSELTDLFCAAFDKMSADVNRVRTLDEFEALDFEESLKGLEDSFDLPDSCMEEKISASDRKKIQKSIDNFINAVINKTVLLTEGEATQAEVEMTFEPMKATIRSILENSETYWDLSTNFENL